MSKNLQKDNLKLSDYEPDGLHHNKPHKCKYPKCSYPCPDLPDCRDAEQPAPPPECKTDAEKTAFAFGWWKALEENRKQPAQQQEPVAWLYPDNLGRKIVWLGAKKPIIPRPDTAEPLYTSPPASKPWVGLTYGEVLEQKKDDPIQFYRAIEAKLKEKNA